MTGTRHIKTAVFCGSFDPIHIGHAMVANHVAQSGHVDELWLVPSRVNPLKTDHPPVADIHRASMCRLVAAKCHNTSVSEVEMKLPLPSYTYRTLRYLGEMYPEREFILLIGSDNWLLFDRWRDYRKIMDEFRILIYPRPGYIVDEEDLPERVSLLSDAPQALISSTFIRDALGKGRNLNFFLLCEVLEYIRKFSLYG